MKYFEIKDNKVWYTNSQDEKKEIDQISRDDLLYLVDKALKSDFEFDSYSDDLIKNQVHNIIYKNIESKFKEMIENKQVILDEINSLYKPAMEKYCKK